MPAGVSGMVGPSDGAERGEVTEREDERGKGSPLAVVAGALGALLELSPTHLLAVLYCGGGALVRALADASPLRHQIIAVDDRVELIARLGSTPDPRVRAELMSPRLFARFPVLYDRIVLLRRAGDGEASFFRDLLQRLAPGGRMAVWPGFAAEDDGDARCAPLSASEHAALVASLFSAGFEVSSHPIGEPRSGWAADATIVVGTRR